MAEKEPPKTNYEFRDPLTVRLVFPGHYHLYHEDYATGRHVTLDAAHARRLIDEKVAVAAPLDLAATPLLPRPRAYRTAVKAPESNAARFAGKTGPR